MTFEEWFDKEGGYDGSFDTYESAAEAAWDARVPEGYVLVPVEPTEKMLTAAWETYFRNDNFTYHCYETYEIIAVYKAMIEAAQEEE